MTPDTTFAGGYGAADTSLDLNPTPADTYAAVAAGMVSPSRVTTPETPPPRGLTTACPACHEVVSIVVADGPGGWIHARIGDRPARFSSNSCRQLYSAKANRLGKPAAHLTTCDRPDCTGEAGPRGCRGTATVATRQTMADVVDAQVRTLPITCVRCGAQAQIAQQLGNNGVWTPGPIELEARMRVQGWTPLLGGRWACCRGAVTASDPQGAAQVNREVAARMAASSAGKADQRVRTVEPVTAIADASYQRSRARALDETTPASAPVISKPASPKTTKGGR